MRSATRLLLVLGLVAFVGCSPIAGTWVSEGGAETAKSLIARVSFCPDGTFTAEAEYGNKQRHAMSGQYCTTGDKLCIMADGQKREYPYSVSGDVLTVGEHKSQLKRLKGCATCCSKCCEKDVEKK